jgi:hypothetical protein
VFAKIYDSLQELEKITFFKLFSFKQKDKNCLAFMSLSLENIKNSKNSADLV